MKARPKAFLRKKRNRTDEENDEDIITYVCIMRKNMEHLLNDNENDE